MRLIELELKNIKSYQHEVISFTEGINCILGLNGSGKSTIIESIGNILFNYNQRTNAEVLRYNEKAGFIALKFEGIDNKRYKIEKNIKPKSSTIKLIDEDTREVLFDSVADVYSFVKKVLGVPKEKSIAKLFEEIIAVPQGSFVNAFLETPKIRKTKFDKLFDLDIYKELADEVKKINDLVEKEYIYKLDTEIATLSGKLINYDLLKEESNDISNLLRESKQQLEDVNNIYNKKKEQKNELDIIIQQLEKVAELKNNINMKNILVKQQLEEAKKKEEISNTAKNILIQNEFAYKLYKITNIQLAENELKYDKYISFQELLNKYSLELTQKEANKEVLQEAIHNLKIQVGNNRQIIIDTKENISILEEKIINTNINIKTIKGQIAVREEILEKDKIDYNIKIQSLNNALNYLLSYNKDDNIECLEDKIKEINNSLIIIKQNQDNIVKLDKELIVLTKDLDNLKNNHSYMKDGMCPILKQKCLNIKGNDLTAEIAKLIEETEKKIENINTKIRQLREYNREEDNLLKEKDYLEIKRTNCINDNERYAELINGLKSMFEEIDYIDKKNDITIINQLLEKYNSLVKNHLDEELENLKNEEKKLLSAVLSSQANVNIDKNKISEIEKNIIKDEADIITKEKELYDLSHIIADYSKKIKDVKESIDYYSGAKAEIEENKKVLENNKNSYELYLKNKETAESNEIYIKECNELKEKSEQLNNELIQIEDQSKVLNEKYSKNLYNELQDAINDLINKKSKLTTTISLKEERKEIVDKEITYLNLLISDKKQKEKDLLEYKNVSNKYKVIRDVYTNLPRVLSEQIRIHIATYASNLYRSISNENVRIEILDDYEVKVIDCLDESKIKYLSQLSGGEQMSVAIAIRLAMLKQTTGIQFYFMDEPTINLDIERRMKVAEVVKDMSKELKQLYVISHDDTFESITDNTIKINKINNISKLEEIQ